MEVQIVWKMFPLLMAVLWVLVTFKFRFLQRGMVNGWLAVTSVAAHSNLLFYGEVCVANGFSTVVILVIIGRSLHENIRVVK